MCEVIGYVDGINKSGRKRRRSWKSIHNRFKSIPSQTYISNFRHYLERHGTKWQKAQKVDELVFKKVIEAREKGLAVHDLDVQRSSLKIARNLKLDDFQGSHYWLGNFKTRLKLVSSKITNFVSHHEVESFDAVQKSKVDFILEYSKLSSHYKPSEILNTDQRGVERKLHSSRTITFSGEKKTFGAVQSKNATTHSYTLQPTISLDEKLFDQIYLCLQEPNGKVLPSAISFLSHSANFQSIF